MNVLVTTARLLKSTPPLIREQYGNKSFHCGMQGCDGTVMPISTRQGVCVACDQIQELRKLAFDTVTESPPLDDAA